MILFLLACNGGGTLGGLQVVEPGVGDPNQAPLFRVHPLGWNDPLDPRPLEGGWVDYDGQRHLRIEAGNQADHTLYVFDDDENVYLSGLENEGILETPALWVPAEVRDGQLWEQSTIDRRVFAQRTEPAVWTFTYENGMLEPTQRERQEITTPTGFYELDFPQYSNNVLSWTESVQLNSTLIGPVTFAEGPNGARWVGQRNFLEADPFVTGLFYLRTVGHGFEFLTGGSTNHLFQGGVAEPVTAHPVDGQLIEGIDRLVLEPPYRAEPFALNPRDPLIETRFASDRSMHARVATGVGEAGLLYGDDGEVLGPTWGVANLHESRIQRGDDVEFRYYTTRPSGRIERVELTDAGLVRTSLGRIELPTPDAQLTAVWERADGALEGAIVLGPVSIVFPEPPLPETVGIRITLPDEADTVRMDPLPAVYHQQLDRDLVRCADPALQMPSVGPTIRSGCELDPTTDATQFGVINGTSAANGAFRLSLRPVSGTFAPPTAVHRIGDDLFALDQALGDSQYAMVDEFFAPRGTFTSVESFTAVSSQGGVLDGAGVEGNIPGDWAWIRPYAEPVVYMGLPTASFFPMYDEVALLDGLGTSLFVLHADGSRDEYTVGNYEAPIFADGSHVCTINNGNASCRRWDDFDNPFDIDNSFRELRRLNGVRFAWLEDLTWAELDDGFAVIPGGRTLPATLGASDFPHFQQQMGADVVWTCFDPERDPQTNFRLPQVCRFGPGGFSRADVPREPDIGGAIGVSSRFVFADGRRTPLEDLEFVLE